VPETLTTRQLRCVRYLAYGSNLHPLRLTDRVPSARLLGSRFVPGWSLHFHKRSNVDGSGKCSIAVPGNGVYAAVYQFERAHKLRLDEIEGLGDGYEEKLIDIADFGPCYTYVATPSHIGAALRPYDWYRDLVILGCEAHGFPEDYVRSVRAVEAVTDTDTARLHRERALVERLRIANQSRMASPEMP
jgi:AIG2-like family